MGIAKLLPVLLKNRNALVEDGLDPRAHAQRHAQTGVNYGRKAATAPLKVWENIPRLVVRGLQFFLASKYIFPFNFSAIPVVRGHGLGQELQVRRRPGRPGDLINFPSPHHLVTSLTQYSRTQHTLTTHPPQSSSAAYTAAASRQAARPARPSRPSGSTASPSPASRPPPRRSSPPWRPSAPSRAG